MTRVTRRSFWCVQLGWLCSGSASAEVVKGKVSKEQWVQSMESVLTPFGKLESRTLQSSRPTDSLPGAPSGKYVIFRYTTKFEKKGSVVETIIPVMEGGEWKVTTYRVR